MHVELDLPEVPAVIRPGRLMLTIAALTDLARRVDYLGWTFTVSDDPWDGPILRIEATVPDARNDGQYTVLGIDTPVPPLDDARQFFDWLAWRLRRIAAHEVREWLRVDGVRIADPHPGPQAMAMRVPSTADPDEVAHKFALEWARLDEEAETAKRDADRWPTHL